MIKNEVEKKFKGFIYKFIISYCLKIDKVLYYISVKLLSKSKIIGFNFAVIYKMNIKIRRQYESKLFQENFFN
jgi:hypothetical protein